MVRRKSSTLAPDSMPKRDLRPDPGHLEQAAKQPPFAVGAEGVQNVRVFAHHQVGEQRDRLAGGRQPIEGRHRRLHFIADAVHVDHEHGRLLDRQAALEKPDHARTAARSTDTRTRPRSAWQTAAASASAASADIRPVEFENAFHHELNLSLFRAPCPDHSLLDLPRRIFEYFRIGIRDSADGGAASLPQFQRAVRIAIDEHAFDRDFLGPVLARRCCERSEISRTAVRRIRPCRCESLRSPHRSIAGPRHPGCRIPCVGSRDRCPARARLHSSDPPLAGMIPAIGA